MSSPTVEITGAAREAYGRGAWREAYERFREAERESRLAADDLERLADAAWWTGRLQDCLAALERAYTGHVSEGCSDRAAFVACRLAVEYAHKLQPSVALGWFSRAERLLEDATESTAQGHLELMRSEIARGRGELARAAAHAQRAYELGRRFADRDLEALGLHHQGYLDVLEGNVDEGFARMDEATVAAVAGELQPRTTAIVYCRTIMTCRDLADYRRAGEWTDAAKRWCERQEISGFPGVCRIHRAELMRLRGAWREAEAEARRACEELREFQLDTSAEGFYEVGEIRLRAGDRAGAAEAFAQADALGRDPLPGLALLRLAEGRAEAAASALRRALHEEDWDRLSRARLLPAWVDVALAVGDVAAAASAVDEMEATATSYGTPALHALAATARGTLALARRELSVATSALRRAARLWRELDFPYELARTRLLLGRAFRETGDEDEAVRELRAACAAFERLGAAPDVRAVAALLEGSERGPELAAASAPALTRTFVFTDIVGSTALAEAMGDEAWREVLRWHDETLRRLIAAHGGEEVAHTGDGVFASFADPGAAFDCSVAIQRALAEHRRAHGFAPPIRIGLHRSEALPRGTDYGGVGVHVAARVAALAQGGEILATREAVDAAPACPATDEPRELELRGVRAPVTVLPIRWR